jgi:hypothetical protein
MTGLREVIAQQDQVSEWQGKIEETVTWITWHEIDEIVRRNFNALNVTNPSVRASMERLVQSIADSIKRHGLEK